jgi:hypothetical protein
VAEKLYELAPINSYQELREVLKKELGYCGCAGARDAIELLRDVLRFAQVPRKVFRKQATQEDWREAYEGMMARLRFEEAPGLATWFLYHLDERYLIGHASNVTVCEITDKGEQLLVAIERWYPPSPDADGAEVADHQKPLP